MNTNNITVLILTAGYGKRMGLFSRITNKGLIPYKDKPIISHIINKFPINTKFVIACGHMGQQVKDYVSTVHNDKNIIFVDIPDYSEGNTGPATTILKCQEHLNESFFWITCDTLFDFNFENKLDHNWIAVSPVDSNISKDYAWVKRDGDTFVEVFNKVESKTTVDAFIGLMFCKDKTFLDNLKETGAKEAPDGFKSNLNLKAYTVSNWLDFGTYDKWKTITMNDVENSFPKPNEIFYRDNDKVIKFFKDDYNVISRIKRASINEKCMPKNIKCVGNFLIHDWVEGDTIYNQCSTTLFQDMLDWCDKNLWIQKTFNKCETINYKFYFEKTKERLLSIRSKYSNWSEPQIVNGLNVKTINEYINQIDFTWLSNVYDWRFIHGDLQFDNVIYNKNTNTFTAIDWRTDFGGELYGDLYYDLAKLLGGIYLNYKMIKEGRYQYIENNNSVTIDIPSIDNYKLYENILKKWVEEKKLNWKKVKTLVPIIYLNMSPLHDYPFDKFLVSLSQLNFERLINEFN